MGTIAIKNTRAKKKEANKMPHVDIDSQARLAEIMSDSPRMAKLAGTDWEIRPLRVGTQLLIAKRVCDVSKEMHTNYSDVMLQFANDIPAVIDVLTYALTNSKERIYRDGKVENGYSDFFNATHDTLMWEGNVNEYATILLETLQLVDVSFFTQALGMLQIFRASVTEKKRERKETSEQN